MTLEESKIQFLSLNGNDIFVSGKGIELINKIHDDFKLELEAEYKRGQDSILSRSCEDCKHSFVRRKGELVLCDIYEELMPIGLTLCNQWEQR